MASFGVDVLLAIVTVLIVAAALDSHPDFPSLCNTTILGGGEAQVLSLRATYFQSALRSTTFFSWDRD